MEKFSPKVLQIGLGLVMVWFGLQQITSPTSWIGYLPEFVNSLPISEITFVSFNGWFEVVFGILLIAGFYTRIVTGLLSLHLLGITFTVGYNEIGVRDFGLSMALVSIFLQGPSTWSLDEYFKKRKLENKTI